jgi:hypothetical protein
MDMHLGGVMKALVWAQEKKSTVWLLLSKHHEDKFNIPFHVDDTAPSMVNEYTLASRNRQHGNLAALGKLLEAAARSLIYNRMHYS